jgi:hypothetical protein
MTGCQDCQQRYCCIVNGTYYCRLHCIRPACYCIRCTIHRAIRDTEEEPCRFCHKDACCYIAVGTGQFQGQAAYRITRICADHCPTANCECLICQEDHELNRFETDVLTIPINHPSIIVRNGDPEAQAYVLERSLSAEVFQGREEELRQVTSRQSTARMVSETPAETGNGNGGNQVDLRERRTRPGPRRTRGNRNDRTGSGAQQAARVNAADGARGASMQRGKGDNRGRIHRRPTRPRAVRNTDSNRESETRRRSLRSWQPDDATGSSHP